MPPVPLTNQKIDHMITIHSSEIIIERAPDARRLPFSRPEIRAALTAMLAALGHPDRGLELRLTGDAPVEELNRRWMATPGPTNILSFPSPDNNSLGSLVLSTHACLREAQLYGQNPGDHCLRLLTHGLTHLLGLDHGPDMDAACEKALEAARAAVQ